MPLNYGTGEDSARRSNQPVRLKGNQPVVGRTGAEVETPVYWSSDANS